MTARLLIAACALLLAAPAAASAHAVLEGSEPARGETLERTPDRVEFEFSEPIEASFGALRVFDAHGEQVEAGGIFRPDGDPKRIAVRLDSDLPDGTYIATYRVVSADSHPISGGSVFSIGAPTQTDKTVGELLGDNVGRVTSTAFGVVRTIRYLAIALLAGGFAFLLFVWLRAVRESGVESREAVAAFERRARRFLLFVVLVGGVATAAGIVLQGATAAGLTFWSALDTDVIQEVLKTRFGTVWSLDLVAWAAAAAGLALAFRARTPALILLGAAALFLVVSPSLAGHAATQSPRGVLIPANAAHVAAMSAWVGGLFAVLVLVPAATRRLPGPDRSRLLAAVLGRFSTVALVCAGVVVTTGVLQGYIHVRSLDNLVETAFGRAVLIKAALFLPLIALGAYNRSRNVPALHRVAEGGEAPGRAGVTLRRALRAEAALFVAVLGVTAALVSYAPATARDAGPFSATEAMGPLELQLTVDPADVGRNEIHIYLFDQETGAQFDKTKELRVDLELPSEDIGPLQPRVSKTGPGHYTVLAADLVPRGDWKLGVSARVSEFDEYSAEVEVPVR